MSNTRAAEGVSATGSARSIGDFSNRTVLLVGPGWLGSAIVEALLAAGAQVWTMRRSVTSEAPPAGAQTSPRGVDRHDLAGDIRSASTDPAILAELPERIDHVVLCVAPSRERGDTHESSYPAATRGALALAQRLGARSVLYTSSTGVYGRTDGSIVTERSPLRAADARQQALVDAERVLLDFARAFDEEARQDSDGNATIAAPGVVVLRVAGLYGPGRDPARRFSDPSMLADGGHSWSNVAWRDDVAAAVLHLLGDSRFHQGAHVFNCADGNPMQAREIAAALGVHVPEDASQTSTAGAAVTSSSRGATRSNQRIAVDALLATGWRPQVSSMLHGLQRLGHLVTFPSETARHAVLGAPE